jgi:sterol desaturase/sphingolipid hydroxylase (fatty acid hydroxylase superfamily)
MIGFVLGFLYGSLLEYVIHDFLFHRLGKKKDSIFSYHLRGHHVLAKKNNFIDLKRSDIETIGLLALISLHIPTLYISVGFCIGVTLYAVAFNFIHSIQHKHPEFTKKYMRWHWEHHMKDSNKNFGVVVPWMDYVFRTRKKYDK